MQQTGMPRKGFSVLAKVVVDRPNKLTLVLVPFGLGDCGVQGLGWYTKRLMMDDDGDFFEEVMPETVPCVENQKGLPRFRVKCNAKQVKVKKQVMSLDVGLFKSLWNTKVGCN